jgi:hypothetical protein
VRYALLICQDEATVSPEGMSERMDAYTAFEDDIKERGLYLAGQRLRPTTTATTVQVRNGDLVVADGPFAETKEQMAGFYLVDCQDLDQAIEVASKIPSAQWGTIEVRPVWEM